MSKSSFIYRPTDSKKTMSKYQGYPYVSPMVNDVPTLDAAKAARWANLPRRPLNPSSPGPSGSGMGSSGMINFPSSSSQPSIPPKVDIDDIHVVYIDMPRADGSDVCQSIESPADEEPEFVHDTILYDQFENRRINEAKDDKIETLSNLSSISDSTYDNVTTPVVSPTRPNRLDYESRGPSNSQSPSSSTPGSSSVPPFMRKETGIYGVDGADGFPLSPIPVSTFPEPPPAYTEFEQSPQSPQSPSVQPAPIPEPPRTQVIVPGTEPANLGLVFDRKYLRCHHCGSNVHTIVVKENGYATYVLAVLLFFFMLPMVLVVIFTDWFKYKNHYCPNCNKIIGYVYPILGASIHYVIT